VKYQKDIIDFNYCNTDVLLKKLGMKSPSKKMPLLT